MNVWNFFDFLLFIEPDNGMLLHSLGGQNKELLRNKNYCPDTNAWRIFFCQPKTNLACLSVLGNFSGQNTFFKFWSVLYKRAELDLRLTNLLVNLFHLQYIYTCFFTCMLPYIDRVPYFH